VPLAFDLADTWRNPVVLFGDYYLGHTSQAVEVDAPAGLDALDKPWALDGSTGGTGRAKLLSPLGAAKQRDGVGYDLAEHYQRAAVATQAMTAGVEPMADIALVDDADLGTVGRFVRAAVEDLRADGHRVGYVRPITLFPFPSQIVATACAGARSVAVYENNLGQMVDDVRLAVLGSRPVTFIGGLSVDSSGFGIGPDIDVPIIRGRILDELERVEGAT
jgi:2-oxoglutarate ferredoxin oxidoreductase subunit alpha